MQQVAACNSKDGLWPANKHREEEEEEEEEEEDLISFDIDNISYLFVPQVCIKLQIMNFQARGHIRNLLWFSVVP